VSAQMERSWAMPSRWTFTILPIIHLLKIEIGAGENWADPFAGENSPATETNDLNPARPTKHHMQAIDFLKSLDSESMDGVLFDPPYSPRQIKECYDEIGLELSQIDTQATFWTACKDEIARVVKPGGKVICFGWNSQGMGMSRGYKLDKVLLVPHGGMHNDTIVTVEHSVSVSLFHMSDVESAEVA
jgi:hypothetical protein